MAKISRESCTFLAFSSHASVSKTREEKNNYFSPTLSKALGDLRMTARFGTDVFIILPLHGAVLNLSPYKVIF